MNKEHLITFAIVVVGVIVALWASTKFKLNSFDEFESVQ